MLFALERGTSFEQGSVNGMSMSKALQSASGSEKSLTLSPEVRFGWEADVSGAKLYNLDDFRN